MFMESVTPYNDDDLITLWQNGNSFAFDIFYKRHIGSLVRIALQKTNCLETAKELAQDVFIEILERKGNLDRNLNINGYIYVALRNKIFNYYRRKAVESKYQDHLSVQNPQIGDTVDNWIRNKELSRVVSASVEELPDRCKAVFLLKRVDNLSNKEVSERLNISTNTVEQHMRKALRKLRVSLSQYL